MGDNQQSREPTLADLVYRLTFKTRGPLANPIFREALQRARKFILDEKMSAFMADLGWEAFQRYPQRRLQYLDELRVSARLPHQITWIEWDEIALAKAAHKYGSQLDPKLVPRKSGWLLMQHPQLETAFKGLSFGVGSTFADGQVASQSSPELGMAPLAFCWSVTDAMPPWKPLNVALDFEVTRGMTMAGMLTGIPAYKGPLLIADPAPHIQLPKNYPAADLRRMMQEQFGMLRYLFALLATINDVPIRETKMVASKGFVAKGRYRKFLDHSVINLTVPQDRYRALARRVVANARRRAHQVRGHWRLDWRFPGHKNCEHQWTALPDKTWQRCAACGAHRMWITEHQRGDASQGFVTHDYAVTHENEGA